ncbi:MAG: enoyl-CoA hydratase/isomerase family protein [Gammaproteobacteria bacterium]|nr:enoyl-CoA hydratase/isomerase family protein [Gammaproteobacteria bacterium]
MSDIEVERKGEVEWIRLNRPDRMNAYDAEMAGELIDAVENASDAGVIVLTGTGRAFCAGGYLANLSDPDPEALRSMFYGSLKVYESLRTSPRPVIAAVNGAAAGGGNELVVACDIAIAAEKATFGQTGVKVGSAPVLGGTNFLSMSVGEKRAKEIAFMCRRYPAKEALEMGLINAVVPAEQLEDEVTKWADELLYMSPRYLEIAKISSNVWWNQCRDNYLSGLAMLVQAIGSADMIEGASAFMEKRRPQFQGRKKQP